MFEIKRDRIYKHSHLDQRQADRLRPLMESAFKDELSVYNNRPAIKEERLRFITEQYANRVRVAQAQGASPLYEDAAIFGGLNPQLKNLFESVSTPGNIINMGNVQNPMNATDVTHGMWDSGYKPGTGDIPSYVFGLQNQLALHCILFDLIPTIAVDTPKPVIIYVDTVYGGGVFDDNEHLPSFVELTSNFFDRTWINARALSRSKTNIILTTKIGGITKALNVTFYVASTIKAAITVEVIATGVCTTVPDMTPGAEADGVFNWNNAYSVKEIIDGLNDSGNSNNVYIKADDNIPAHNYYNALTQAIYINYASATRTNIVEASTNNNSLKGMTREEHEKGPKYKLNVVAIDKQLDIQGLEIEADTTNIQIKDMAAMGINVISYLYSGVQNQLVQSLDEIGLNHLYALGVEHAANVKASQGIDYNLYIGPTGNTYDIQAEHILFKDMNDIDRSGNFRQIPSTGDNGLEGQISHNERLYRRILLVAEFLKQQNRIGGADAMVLSGELSAAVKAHATFTIAPTVNTLSEDNNSLSYYGTIYGNIHVYKNSKIAFNDPRILLMRRGDDKDPGAKLLAYDLAASRQIIAEQTMAEKIRVWSRFTIADIGFYPELNYFTFIAVNDFKFA